MFFRVSSSLLYSTPLHEYTVIYISILVVLLFPLLSSFLLLFFLSLPSLLSSSPPCITSLFVCLPLFCLLYLFVSHTHIPDPSSSIVPGAWMFPLGLSLPHAVPGIHGSSHREVSPDLSLLKFICNRGSLGTETGGPQQGPLPPCINFYSSIRRGEVLTHHPHSDSKTLPSGLG